ncbi:hypothetical protein PVK06_027764 [Gossypium arboreum]|uniref:Reverse transcriptase zinc-binding domain-containing protein n=1 Tax=Gossypium arboreum TaxID=29729 RepID=A0ABR0P2F2_GOSAR|nr:hypothetical protein PVK06_027764 [Gossypium arboreum]
MWRVVGRSKFGKTIGDLKGSRVLRLVLTRARLMWKLQTLAKIRIFCWRLRHDILPTYEKIFGICREVNSTYPRCRTEKETLLHALRNCPRVKDVLVYGGLNNMVLEGCNGRCVDWIKDVARSLDKKAFSDFITVLWNIWNSQNNRVFRGVKKEAKVTRDKTATLS